MKQFLESSHQTSSFGVSQHIGIFFHLKCLPAHCVVILIDSLYHYQDLQWPYHGFLEKSCCLFLSSPFFFHHSCSCPVFSRWLMSIESVRGDSHPPRYHYIREMANKAKISIMVKMRLCECFDLISWSPILITHIDYCLDNCMISWLPDL